MTHRRIPSACMLLFAVTLAITSSIFVSAFGPFLPHHSSGRNFRNEKTELRVDGEVNGNSVEAGPDQSEYGKSLELPDTYASCGQCGASFALTLEAMGPGKGGRRMECSICDHTWFQSRDRLVTLGEGFEMIPLPERDLDRIALNIKEGRHPKHYGNFKMYVGNISFQCTEEDVFELFETIGPVGDVSLVRDNTGRPRGFGFITMRTEEDGERAIKELDGTELKGRNLNVRPSNN
eukprot:CAMPEP_0197180592 /NCGR_PEP_ID=MMETSP1423-20130617/5151_1 /TAXON_ID=476441 /ORGANISM="Pseudo-nitzschia heimii, Strain UNC1101" /LENGTH=234 /DNA_ID=CAMNT_0042630691 /DNA_START=203 /DNA_END=907 /DNA_ORIENTATION=-